MHSSEGAAMKAVPTTSDGPDANLATAKSAPAGLGVPRRPSTNEDYALASRAIRLNRGQTGSSGGKGNKTVRHIHHHQSSALQLKLQHIEESLPFQLTIIMIIMIDLVVSVVFIANDETTPPWFEIVILVILWVGITFRILAHGRKFILGDGRALNIFEFGVVIFCTAITYLESEAGTAIPTGWMRILGRVARFVRTCVKAHQQKDRLLKAAQRKAQAKTFEVLKNMLGDVLNFPSDCIHVDPLSGKFELWNAEVVRENLDDLHLPLTVIGGFIGGLGIDVGNIMMGGRVENKDIRISLYNACLIMGPIVPDWETDTVRRRKENLVELLTKRLDILKSVLGGAQTKEQMRKKQEKAQKAEEGANRSEARRPSKDMQKPKDVEKKDTQADKMKRMMIKRVLNHLVIDVANVCVRYEDIRVLQPNPFVCGINLGFLHSEPTRQIEDPTASPEGDSRSGRSRGKLSRRGRSFDAKVDEKTQDATRQQTLNIDQLYIFCDTETPKSFTNEPGHHGASLSAFVSSRLRERIKLKAVGEMERIFQDSPSKKNLLRGPMFRERFDMHSYMLFPMSIQVNVVRRRGAIFEPPLSLSVALSSVRGSLDNRQVECFNRLTVHVKDWFRNSSRACTRPLQSVLALRGGPYQEYRANVQQWWQHCVRLMQLKLQLKPDNISSTVKAQLAKPLEAEYLDLMIQQQARQSLSRGTFDKIEARRMDIQVVLPVITVLRLRLTAKRTVQDLLQEAGKKAEEEEEDEDSDKPGRMSSHIRRSRRCWCCSRAQRDDEEDEGAEDENDGTQSVVDDQLYSAQSYSIHVDSDGHHEVDSEDEEDEDEEGESSMHFTDRKYTTAVGSAKGLQGDAITCNVSLEVEFVEVFVMMHTFWGSCSSVLSYTGIGRVGVSDREFESRAPNDVGGFGLERFGIPHCPRRPFLSAVLQDAQSSLALPWSASGGWQPRIEVNASLANVSAQFFQEGFDGSLNEKNVLKVEAFTKDSETAGQVVATLSAHVVPFQHPERRESKQEQLSESLQAPSTPAAKDGKVSKMGLGTILKTSWWTGKMRLGAVKGLVMQPTVDRLLSVLATGKKQSEVELELELAVLHLRKKRNPSNGLNRLLTKIEDKWKGNLEFHCELATISVELYQRYQRNLIMVTNLSLGAIQPQFELTSKPLDLHVKNLQDLIAGRPPDGAGGLPASDAEEESDPDAGTGTATASSLGKKEQKSSQASMDLQSYGWTTASEAVRGPASRPERALQEAPSSGLWCAGLCMPSRLVEEVAGIPELPSRRQLEWSPRHSTAAASRESRTDGGVFFDDNTSTAKGFWGLLPWHMDFKFVNPVDVDLQAYAAARAPEDFNYLDVKSRRYSGVSYGSWHQLAYLHERRHVIKGSPNDIESKDATASARVSKTVFRYAGDLLGKMRASTAPGGSGGGPVVPVSTM